MAKFELRFIDCYYDEMFLECKKGYVEPIELDTIEISLTNSVGDIITIDLDKSTAIKFAKTLRTEINKITESEVNNGRG